MDKQRLLAPALVVLVLLALFAAYQTAGARAQAEIARIRQDSATLHMRVDSIRAVASIRDSLRTELEALDDVLRGEAEQLREDVMEMEASRASAQLGVWLLRGTDEVERQFRTAFPEFAEVMRVTEMQPAPDLLPLRYLMVPFQTARTFVVYRQNSESFEAQRDALAELDSLNRRVIVLSDSVNVLTRLNAESFRMGMDSAFAQAQSLATDYIRELERPALNFEVPNRWALIGGAAAGIALGAAIR